MGLATALKITAAHADVRLLLLEKEAELARHQTGNNSGVIHSGLYYRPGSLKAQSCVIGRKTLIDFCDEISVPYEICGKVVVATIPEELQRLKTSIAVASPMDCKVWRLSAAEVKEIEPHATGIKALYVPETGIVDYKKSRWRTGKKSATPTATSVCHSASSESSTGRTKSFCKRAGATIGPNI